MRWFWGKKEIKPTILEYEVGETHPLPTKVILHLCADTGSDTMPYENDPDYIVVLVGIGVGVENFSFKRWQAANGIRLEVHGIVANPPCLEFSTARSNGKARNPEEGMFLVKECQRIIAEAKEVGHLKWWVIENPAKGRLKDYLGPARYQYEPWWYGSPWSKRTALWGEFEIPQRKYLDWSEVPKIPELYVRPGRGKPSLAFMHKSAIKLIPEFDAIDHGRVDSDMEFRSLCSQQFAQAFKAQNP